MRVRSAGGPRKNLILWSVLLLLGPAARHAVADDFTQIRNNFGTLGMIDMPSARMAPDGEISAGATYFENNQRYNLGFQALPWLETDIRYSGLDHFLFEPEFPVYWDRSFAAKARLWQESDLIPAVAVGINDLVGTGVYSGEYLVGSKRFGSLDFSLGIGWGRMASTEQFKNPLATLLPSFGNPRESNVVSTAGGFNFKAFFHGGYSALFGGVVWQTPVKNLSLMAEYSSDAYILESQTGNFSPRNQVNYGVSYRVSDGIALSLEYLYGRSVGGNISFDMDPMTYSSSQRVGPPQPPAPPGRSPEQQQQALNLMKGRRTGIAIHSEQFTGSGELVDALWRGTNDLVDVAVQGRRLMLTVERDDPSRDCQAAAKIVGMYSMTITTITVTNGSNRASCPVTTSPALALLGPTVGAQFSTMTISPSIMPAAFITIDAAVEPKPDIRSAISHIRTDAGKQRITIDAISITDTEMIVYYTNPAYFSEAEALDRVVRLLMTDAPPQVEKFRLIAVEGSIPQREFDVLRAPAERSFAQNEKLNFTDNVSQAPAPMQNPVFADAERGLYPQFSWDIFPQFRQQLFDPSNPLGVQFLVAASGTAELFRGLTFNGEVEGNIWSNFNTNRPSDSVLPHVRTDFARYFTEGKNGIGMLDTEYRFRLAPDVFAVVKGGYLESMFAGVGGEVLWRPEGQRWAVGADLYGVQQRDFDRLFGLQPYHALTGHLSLYYASPWYGFNFLVRAGQYLAQDRGITLQVSRRFSTGVEVGAFLTKTNVSSEQFGEGSFDKGIVIRIPIGWAVPIDTQTELDTVLRPVQRDGGQELAGDATLYEETRRTSEAEIVNTLGGQ